MFDHYKEWATDLDSDERRSIDSYQRKAAFEMNASLRDPDLSPEEREDLAGKALYKWFSNAMKKAEPLKENVYVNRAARWNDYPKEGERFVDHGWSSTSLDAGVAEVARSMQGYPQTAVIELPPESRGIFLPASSDIGDNEFVVDRGGIYEMIESKADRLKMRLVGWMRGGVATDLSGEPLNDESMGNKYKSVC